MEIIPHTYELDEHAIAKRAVDLGIDAAQVANDYLDVMAATKKAAKLLWHAQGGEAEIIALPLHKKAMDAHHNANLTFFSYLQAADGLVGRGSVGDAYLEQQRSAEAL